MYTCATHGAHSSFTIRRDKTFASLLRVSIKAHLQNGIDVENLGNENLKKTLLPLIVIDQRLQENLEYAFQQFG